MAELLRVEDLRVGFTGDATENIIRGAELTLEPGETVAVTGPSGAGKSLLARVLLGLPPRGARFGGRIFWRGEELIASEPERWRQVRGRGMVLVPQEPSAALDPVVRIGDQIAETVRHHHGLARRPAFQRAVQLLGEVCMPAPREHARCFPHQLSGGMRQRALLAAALACDPALLIADEPTASLDLTVQREIVALVARIRRDRGMALLFISHDLDLVPLLADRRVDLRGGILVGTLLDRPRDGLGHGAASAPAGETVLSGRGLVARYPRGLLDRPRQAGATAAPLRGVDIDVAAGGAVAVAGESGCGKTTLARVLAGHLAPVCGSVVLEGADGVGLRGRERRRWRRRVQLLFQDPGQSLNPRQSVGESLIESARAGGQGAAASASRVAELLGEVGLPASFAERYPHALSGGQRQRVALARCLAVDPLVLVADEPTSALDPVAAAKVMDLLHRIMAKRNLALMVISHDVGLLQRHCANILVMHSGLVVERFAAGDPDGPRHPYTLALLAARPAALDADPAGWPEGPTSATEVSLAKGAGCPHAGACPLQKPSCFKELPQLLPIAADHDLRCPEADNQAPPHFIDTL